MQQRPWVEYACHHCGVERHHQEGTPKHHLGSFNINHDSPVLTSINLGINHHEPWLTTGCLGEWPWLGPPQFHYHQPVLASHRCLHWFLPQLNQVTTSWWPGSQQLVVEKLVMHHRELGGFIMADIEGSRWIHGHSNMVSHVTWQHSLPNIYKIKRARLQGFAQYHNPAVVSVLTLKASPVPGSPGFTRESSQQDCQSEKLVQPPTCATLQPPVSALRL